MMMKKVERNGKEYPSVTAAAKAEGVHRNTMSRWLKNNCDDDTSGYLWNNTRFSSISAAARSRGYSLDKMFNLIKQGYTGDAEYIFDGLTKHMPDDVLHELTNLLIAWQHDD